MGIYGQRFSNLSIFEKRVCISGCCSFFDVSVSLLSLSGYFFCIEDGDIKHPGNLKERKGT